MAIRDSPGGACRSSILSARISRAFLRFASRDRENCELTTIPVGMCFNWTLEDVLLIYKKKKKVNPDPVRQTIVT